MAPPLGRDEVLEPGRTANSSLGNITKSGRLGELRIRGGWNLRLRIRWKARPGNHRRLGQRRSSSPGGNLDGDVSVHRGGLASVHRDHVGAEALLDPDGLVILLQNTEGAVVSRDQGRFVSISPDEHESSVRGQLRTSRSGSSVMSSLDWPESAHRLSEVVEAVRGGTRLL